MGAVEREVVERDSIFPTIDDYNTVRELAIEGELVTPVVFLVDTPFAFPAQIHQTDARIDRGDELGRLIDEVAAWDENRWRDRFPERDYPDNEKVLVLDVWADEGMVNIAVGTTCYTERLATQDQEVGKRFGVEAVAFTLGVSAVIKTRDNKLLLAILKRTDPHHADKIDCPHVMGGIVEPDKDGIVDPEEHILDEITQETGIGKEHLVISTRLGVIEHRMSVDILYVVETVLTEEEIRGLSGDKEIELLFVDNTNEAVEVVLRNVGATGGAVGSLYLYGRMEYGEAWAERVKENTGLILGGLGEGDSED